MSLYKFQLTFLSVVDVSFCFGYTGCVLFPQQDENIAQIHLVLRSLWMFLIMFASMLAS